MLAVFTVFWFPLSATSDEDSNGLNGVLITVYMIKVILNTNKMRFKVCFLRGNIIAYLFHHLLFHLTFLSI